MVAIPKKMIRSVFAFLKLLKKFIDYFDKMSAGEADLKTILIKI